MKRLTSSLIILIFFWLALPAIAFKIYIDPGHYVGDDRCDLEIETNLAVGLKLRALLENADTLPGVDWEVRMSRTDGKGIAGQGSLSRRARDANNFEADLFISIHCNGQQNEDCDGNFPGNGTETFWCDLNEAGNLALNRDKSTRLAKLVQKHMVRRGEWRDRRVVEDHSYLGHHLLILLLSEAPGCLNEIGFVDNANDRKKLQSDHWRNKFAEAYRDAIYEYFGLPLPTYLEMTLAAGWNAISIPGTPVSSYPWSTIIRSIPQSTILYRRDPVDTEWGQSQKVKFGEGYLIRSYRGRREDIHISYFTRDEYTIHLEKGYNMVGSVSHNADFRDGVNRSIWETLQTWDPSSNKLQRVTSGTIRPGKGYFVFAHRPTELTIRSDAQAAPTHTHENIPGETQVFVNFPNPFNPETWIPYQLSKSAEVTVTIYTADGRVVRTLVLGHQHAGVYQDKNRAAYWDGRNTLGEPVASGVYFYTLTAGEFSATRKMLIRK